MPPTRRRSSPNPEDLAGLREEPPATGRLRKAPTADPVLGVASGTGPLEIPTAELPSSPRRSTPSASAGKAKVGFYQDPDDTARARAAFNWTRAQEGHRSFSDFVSSALMREVERLESQYHHGDPWPPMEAGELPTGKPFGT